VGSESSSATVYNHGSSLDTTGPTVTSVSTTADNQSAVSITDNITVTFSEAMDNTSYKYKYIDELLSWENANNYCAEQGGHLPALNSAEEHSMLSELCFSSSGNEDCWIGLNDIDLEDDFQWANGTAYPTDGYTFNWTWNRADRDCFVLEGYNHNGSIEGDFCNSAKNFLCEIPPSVTTNTDNTSCYGTLRVSSDNFSSCVQMASSPSSSNSDMTFTLDPSDNLTVGTTYLTRVTTGVKDAAGNEMSSQYETTTGFTIYSSGTIKGTVKQSNGNALSDVLVSFSGANVDSTTTDNSGNFNKSLGLGSYTLTYTKSGYISTTQSSSIATDNQTVVVATVTLLSSSSCSAGNISGTIKDAVSGSAISGVSISIRSGSNVRIGSTISGKTDTTDSDGAFSLSSVDAGVYTAQASKSGYIPTYFNVNVCGNVSNQDANMSTSLNSETMRIVVSWKGTDDLDSHLEIPVSDAQDGASNSTDSTHLFYGVNQGGVSANDYHNYTDIVSSGDNVTLDQDNGDGSGSPCGNGCGPETITISKIRSGTYRYHVHNYTRKGNNNNSKLAESEATVQVFYNDNSTTFYVPNSAGNLWTVFDFDNSSGFNALNTIADESDAKKVDDH
jgi:hypothetical protein